MDGEPPTFLELPPRSAKPRTSGLTHVIDPGHPLTTVEVFLEIAGPAIDMWKFGFGTAYLDRSARRKISLLEDHGVLTCVGGTLLEASWVQHRVDACLAWLGAMGVSHVEVSNGAVPMGSAEKRSLIRRAAAAGFGVLAEVGSKDPDAPVNAATWTQEMLGDLEAGASLVLAEGRANGTVGLYQSDGSVRADLVEQLAESVDRDRMVFEAPRSDQQAWFIRRFGGEVNLGNVQAAEVPALEALRLGLRADTLMALAPAGLGTPP